MKTSNSNLKTFNCKKCKKVVAFIKDGSKLKKGIVFLCEECYSTMEAGNLFNDVFRGLK